MILTLLAEGESPKQIASKLGTSAESISQTIKRLRDANDCQTTTELVCRWALTHKIQPQAKRQGGQAA